MARISIFIAFLPHLLCAMIQKHQSVCSEYFTYMTKPGITDMLGQIEITPPSVNDMFYLKVALSTTTELNQIVRLELARSIKESLRDVHQGRPLLYHVCYPMNEQIPSLSAIWFNNQRYCPDPEVSDNITANVELGHILSPPYNEPIVYNDGPWQQISQPWHRNVSKYRIDNPSYDRLNHYSGLNECGITSYYTDDTNRLIPDGETTLPGQWPWLVAIYTQDNEKYRFKCAGSILTTRHVITQGWCIKESSYRLIEPQNLWVTFGQLKSSEWDRNHTGIINRVVANYTLIPFDPLIPNVPGSLILAILLLRTAVEYNSFIRPVCIWSGSNNLQDIINMTGYHVGWGYKITWVKPGYDAWVMYTGEPRMSKVQLANISVDTYSEYGLYYNLEDSDSFYCPDIGSGLVVFNTNMGRYQLRGVTVNCVRGTILFFDVTKVTSWIQQQIQLT